jgi:hypothetical protein
VTEARSTEQSPLPTDQGGDDHKRRRSDQHRQQGSAGGRGAKPEIGRRGTTLPDDSSPTMGELFDRVTGSARGSRAVSVEVGETQAAIDLTVTVPYGRSIPEATKEMRDNVIRRVERFTGLVVTEVNITLKDVFFPEQQ